MKIVLIHPNHENSTDSRLDPPLGLLYLAAHLQDYDVSIVDLSGITEVPNLPYADYYGITVYITSIKTTIDIITKCKEANPNGKIIVGGAHPTARPNDFPYVDHVVVGYGERALLDIITGKETNHIVYGKETDSPIFPAYHLTDLNSYSRKIDGKHSIPYLTTRGCYYHCNFCGLEQIHNLLGYHVKMVDSSVVIDHLNRIHTEYNIDTINFQDDIFTLNPKRLYKILDALSRMNMRFRCMGRSGYDKEETYKRLADSGCKQISWGIESGSQYILDRMNKQVKTSDNYNVIQWAKKYGINTRTFFIIGFPGETEETLTETKNFIIDADPDQVFVSTMVPYPGTTVGDNPKDYGITKMYYDYNNYYQVGKDGTGGELNFDTQWLSRKEFRALEMEFRNWVLNERSIRGCLQDYETKLYKR